MVAYEDETTFPAPRATVWKLLRAHLDDAAIGAIHPLIKRQTTVSRSEPVTVVDRTIDARGKMLRSRWKITYREPDVARWEIEESQGPWATGSYIENTYTDSGAATTIRGRGDMTISVLPFFLPQRWTIQRVFADIHEQDVAYARRLV